ncbi:hypothetical protein HGRIS_000706 [Hohenbuehelia grisea]|uniref:Fungal N-terminal domain-containing protein n=1 Tax=Hohenbuehelia grisea TaxID=104357 RepID=A0ABR3JSL4_9AGAR
MVPVDPLSVAASVLAFTEAISKLWDTFDKVGQNRNDFQQAKNEVLRGLVDIERFCVARSTTLDDVDSTELDQALGDLERSLTEVRFCAEVYLSQKTSGILSSARSKAKAWFYRDQLESEVIRLFKVNSSRLRFLSFSSARTESNTLQLLQDQKKLTERVDALFSLET